MYAIRSYYVGSLVGAVDDVRVLVVYALDLSRQGVQGPLLEILLGEDLDIRREWTPVDDPGPDAVADAAVVSGEVPVGTRITSYNVCYTKLLRT